MALMINDVPIGCINQAAIMYHVPAKLIISVLRTEGGKKGSATSNSNGTYDYGPMQINSVWLKQLRSYGYSVKVLRYNSCLNIKAGTWILAKAIASEQQLWQGVGNYHSHTQNLNLQYQQKISREYRKISQYLLTY